MAHADQAALPAILGEVQPAVLPRAIRDRRAAGALLSALTLIPTPIKSALCTRSHNRPPSFLS